MGSPPVKTAGEIEPEPLPASSQVPQFRQHMGQISRQSSVYFFGAIFTTAAGYLFKVYLARVLGAEDLGIYALGMTIVGFLSLFNALGLPQSAVRFVAAYVATEKWDLLRGFIARGTLLIGISNLLLAGALVWFGRWIAVHFYHTPALETYLGLFAAILVLGALTNFFGQALVGYKNVARRTIITDFIGTPAVMVATLALIALGFGLWGYIFAQVVGASLVLLLFTRDGVEADSPRGAETLRETSPAGKAGHFVFCRRFWGELPGIPYHTGGQDTDRFLSQCARSRNLCGRFGVGAVCSDSSAIRKRDLLADDFRLALPRAARAAWPDFPDSYQVGPWAYDSTGRLAHHFCTAVYAYFRPRLRSWLAHPCDWNRRTTGKLRGWFGRVSSADVGQ